MFCSSADQQIQSLFFADRPDSARPNVITSTKYPRWSDLCAAVRFLTEAKVKPIRSLTLLSLSTADSLFKKETKNKLNLATECPMLLSKETKYLN